MSPAVALMNLSNENKLLLCCAQVKIPEATLVQVKNLVSLPLDWQEVLKSALWHRIAPLLYHNLKGIRESHSIPQGFMAQLKKAYYESMATNMRLYSELSRVLDTFRKKGVEIIVLKGAALAEIVYGNIALRPMVDIDLMIKKEDLAHVEKIISELGYVYSGTRSPEWYRENNYHVQYANQNKKILVEMHWHILSKSEPAPIAITDISLIERWWQRALKSNIAGRDVLILCPDDLLFYLALHFVKHRFQSPNGGFRGVFSSRSALLQLCDIFQTIKHYGSDIDWERFQFEAERYRAASIIYSPFYLIREIMINNEDVFKDMPAVSAPETLDDELNELVELIGNRMFDREYVFSVSPMSFFYSILAGNFRHKIKNVLTGIFPHLEIVSHKYSIPLSSKKLYFYYLTYLLDFIKRNRRQISGSLSLKEVKIINKWLGPD